MKKVLLAVASVFTGLTAALWLLISILAFSSADNSNSNLIFGIISMMFVVLPFGILSVFASKRYRAIESKPQQYQFYFPSELPNGERLYKQYDYIEICIINGEEPDFKTLNIGDKLTFIKQPTNMYDPRAIAIYNKNQKLGYVSRGIGQDMTHDFLDQGNPILAELSAVDKKQKKLKMHIAYYYTRKQGYNKKFKCPCCNIEISAGDSQCRYCGTVITK